MWDGRTAAERDSSVMARMQKKFWKTKQVLIKATGKKEDEHVVASDADLDAKLEFFQSVQLTCSELQSVIERYQLRISCLSQEEHELGLFLRYQADRDRTQAGRMMEATSKAVCTSAKLRLALVPPLRRLHQEVETFRRRAIADSQLTVGRMEKTRTEYRGALLWMKDVSQELDPDTYKQLEKFRKVQAQVRSSKAQFDKLKNDVCQKVDVLGASRCNMLSHSLVTYQDTLLNFWEKTAPMMAAIHEAFKGQTSYQFTALKVLQDNAFPDEDAEALEESKEALEEAPADTLISLEDEDMVNLASEGSSCHSADVLSRDSDSSLCASLNSALYDLSAPLGATTIDDELGLLDLDPKASHSGLISALLDAPEVSDDGFVVTGTTTAHKDQLTEVQQANEDGEKERGYPSFLQDLLGTGPTGNDEFSREWQEVFGCFESAPVPAVPAPPPSLSPTILSSPASFLPSQLLDRTLHSTGWATPPMFHAPPMQTSQPADQTSSPQDCSSNAVSASKGTVRDMSAWFDLFADLDPLSNPDAIGRSGEELLNA